MLVSVIITNYNYGEYVGQAIESVLSQSHEDIEVLVVDDGSTDNSRNVITSFSDERVHLKCQENHGQAAAFNAGFEMAQGEWISFLDADDKFMQHKIENVLKVIRAYSGQPRHNAGMELVAVQHPMQVVDAQSVVINSMCYELESGLHNVLNRYFAENHTGFFYQTSGITCRKSVLNQIFPLDVSWRICADVALTRPLPLFGAIYTIGEVLGQYRVHGQNSWMNSEAQKRRIENEAHYCAYVNSWLKRRGVPHRIEYEQSAHYRRRKSLAFDSVTAEARGRCDEIEQLRAEVAYMRNSLSWRVTAPLRLIRRLLPG